MPDDSVVSFPKMDLKRHDIQLRVFYDRLLEAPGQDAGPPPAEDARDKHV